MAHDEISAYPLVCPICGEPLVNNISAFRCPAGHAFDIARQGYVNLLPPQHRRRGIEGDSAEMVRARRRFLEKGHYRPLRDAVTETIAAILAEVPRSPSRGPRPVCVLEAGCGEGYYIGGCAAQFTGSAEVCFLGADLSKHAVKKAAAGYPGVLFFVADTHRRLYVESCSTTVVLDVFAPRNPAEFARILEPAGHLVMVVPGPGHLAGLRERLSLLDIPGDKEAGIVDDFTNGWTLHDRRDITFPLHLTPPAVRDLVDMGPNYWHRDRRDVPPADTPVDTEASCVILHFRRT